MSGRLLRNVASLALSQGAALALNFVLWVHLGRTLGAEGIGRLAFGLALVSYFVLAVALGFDVVGIREVKRDPGLEARIVPELLGVRLVLAVVATAAFASATLAMGLEPAYQAAVLVLGAHIVARAIRVDWVYQARERMGVSAVYQAATSAVTAAVALAFVRRPADLLVAALALAAGPLVAAVGVLAAYAREVRFPWPRFDRVAWVALLAPAVPLAASSLVSQVYYNVDKLMLEWLRATAEVGLYEVSYKLYALAVAPASVLYVAFYPGLAGALGDRDAMAEAARQFGRVMVALGPPLALACAVVAPDLIRLVFGAEYLGATVPLRVLLAYAALAYLSMTYGVPLMAWDDEKAYFWAILGGGLANVVLNVSLIGPFGPTGAAVATLASEAVVTVGMARHFRRHTGTLLPDTLVRGLVVAVLGGLAPTALGAALGLPVLVTLPVAAAVTLGVAWAAGLLSPAALVALVLRR